MHRKALLPCSASREAWRGRAACPPASSRGSLAGPFSTTRTVTNIGADRLRSRGDTVLHIRNELPGEGSELSKEGRLPVAPTELVAYKRGSGETARGGPMPSEISRHGCCIAVNSLGFGTGEGAPISGWSP